MSSSKHLGITLFTSLLLFASGLAHAKEPDPAPGGCAENELFLNLTSDDTWRAGMALGFASRNLEQGYPVTIFLNVEGVRIAVKDQILPRDTYGLTDETSQEALMTAMGNGARVIVCPHCLIRAGFEPSGLIEGVYLGGPVSEILHCSSHVMSY